MRPILVVLSVAVSLGAAALPVALEAPPRQPVPAPPPSAPAPRSSPDLWASFREAPHREEPWLPGTVVRPDGPEAAWDPCPGAHVEIRVGELPSHPRGDLIVHGERLLEIVLADLAGRPVEPSYREWAIMRREAEKRLGWTRGDSFGGPERQRSLARDWMLTPRLYDDWRRWDLQAGRYQVLLPDRDPIPLRIRSGRTTILSLD